MLQLSDQTHRNGKIITCGAQVFCFLAQLNINNTYHFNKGMEMYTEVLLIKFKCLWNAVLTLPYQLIQVISDSCVGMTFPDTAEFVFRY